MLSRQISQLWPMQCTFHRFRSTETSACPELEDLVVNSLEPIQREWISVRALACASGVHGALDMISNDLIIYECEFLTRKLPEGENAPRERHAWVAKLVGIKASGPFVGLLKYEPSR